MQGWSSRRMAQELGRRCGCTPDPTTVSAWVRESDEIPQEMERRIMENALERMEPDPRHLPALNMISGTKTDKLLRAQELARGHRSNVDLERFKLMMQAVHEARAEYQGKLRAGEPISELDG